VLFRSGAGRLSELFGDSQLDRDRFIRTLGWRDAAENDLAAMSVDTRKLLDAYSSGVNAWLDQHADLPLPFVITGLLGAGGGLSGFKPEPWTALDTLTWQKVQAWSLGSNWDSELFRLIAKEKGLSADQIAQLVPPYDPTRPTVLPPSASAAQTSRSASAFVGTGSTGLSSAAEASQSADLAKLLDIGDGLTAGIGLASGGSNGWVVSPAKSATGHALLANDPHLGISMPSLWFLVGLHCETVSDACPYDVAGASFPGVPGIVLGHNDRIAWGLTNVGPDVQDLFEETVDPQNSDHYIYKGKSIAFDTHAEAIYGKGGKLLDNLFVRSTIHGPVLSDVVADLRAKSEGGSELGVPGKVYALEWTAINQPDLTLQAVLNVNKAQNWDQFRTALQDFGAPSQTFLYADVDGNIGVQIPGKIPVRAAGDGSAPVPGDTGAYDWTGYVPFDQLPSSYNPPEGLIEASNQLPSRSGPFLGSEFDPGYRAARVHELLDPVAKIDVGLMRSVQGDVKLTRAQLVAAAVSGAAPATADGKKVRELIGSWATPKRDQLTCTVDSTGCAAYETFEYRLLRDTFDDELGASGNPDDLATRYVGQEPSHEFISHLVADPTNAWWDDVTTAGKKETRDDIMATALDEAGADLRASLGDPANWTWGRIHTVTFAEQTLGVSGVGPLEALFNKGPFPAPGSCTTVDKICGSISNEYPAAGQHANLQAVFAADSSPSYRLVIDMGDMDNATILNTTGESGLPFDSHYGDLISPWLTNQPVPLYWTKEHIDGVAKNTLTMAP